MNAGTEGEQGSLASRPWRVVSTRALTSFVGRRHELARLRVLLSETRLVTITGAGGAGKTRLAEELAGRLARSFGSAAFVYLAAAREPNQVVETIAASVGLTNRGEHSVRDELTRYLCEKRILLLLDNCEHVADTAAGLAADLLGACPGVVILATSRQPLHLPGEQVFPIGGLLPDIASELFADRARRAAPDFTLDASSAATVKEICVRLEGMPLAIELAAAQVRSFGLAELDRRLEGRLPDLSSRTTVGPGRQRNLRQTIAWSHDLLTEEQRVVWRRLAVFAGGFTLDASETVVGWPPLTAADVRGLIADLVDQSMVVFEPSTDRYRLLEALREFAEEELTGAGEATIAAERHRRWMLGFARDCDTRWYGPDQAFVLDRLGAEGGNLHVALANCRETGAMEDGLRLTTAAFWYWLTRASLDDGLRWFAAFLGRSGDPALEARAHWRSAMLSTIHLEFGAAKDQLERSLEFAGKANDAVDRAYARAVAAFTMTYEHPREEARRVALETLEDLPRPSQPRALTLVGLAIASIALGEMEDCRTASLECVGISREARDLWSLELGLRYYAQAEWRLGRPETARAALAECLSIDQQIDDFGNLAWSIESLAWVTLDMGRFERAARLLGIASGLWAKTGTRLAGPWRKWHDAAVEKLAARLGQTRFETEMAAARASTRAEALAFATGEPVAAPGSLTPEPLAMSQRELEVAALVAAGLGNRAIAEKLFLSPRTVEKHVKHAMDKLGVGSRSEIAAWYARRPT